MFFSVHKKELHSIWFILMNLNGSLGDKHLMWHFCLLILLVSDLVSDYILFAHWQGVPESGPVWPHQQCIAYFSNILSLPGLHKLCAIKCLDCVRWGCPCDVISYPKGWPPWKPREDSFYPFWAEILCSCEPEQRHMVIMKWERGN